MAPVHYDHLQNARARTVKGCTSKPPVGFRLCHCAKWFDSRLGKQGDPGNLLFLPEHQNLQQRYEKRERECEAKNKEKEDMMVTLNKMKDKLERECNDHKQAKIHLAEMSAQLQQIVSSSVPNIWSPDIFSYQSHHLDDSASLLDVLCSRRTSSDIWCFSRTCSSSSQSSSSSCTTSTSRRSSSFHGPLCSTTTTTSRSSSRSSKEEEYSPTVKPIEVLQLEQTSRSKV